MTLIDEREVYYEQERKRKIFKSIITAIIALVVLAIILLIFIKVKNYGKISVVVDGKTVSNYSKTLILKNDNGSIYNNNGQIYLSVKDMCNLLDRPYYNNEYKKKGEDQTRCHIKNGDEYTSIVADSKKVYKAIIVEPDSNQLDSSSDDSFQEIPENEIKYEYFEIGDAVKYVNDNIYASTEAIELAFDVAVSYDTKKNTITISSLEYLENIAKSRRSDVADSSKISYANKRLLKYGMCVVNGSNGNLGVGSYTNGDKLKDYVASCKYSSINFNEAAGAIDTISNEGKHSIIKLNFDNQGIEKTVVSDYDDIEIMDNDCNLFKVKSQNLYGVMDSDKNLILPNDFDEIGINDALYTDISSKYILRNKYIPVKKEGLWGLCDIQGNTVITPNFQGIGCPLAQSGESVIVVPDATDNADGIVFLYNKSKSLYGLYSTADGKKIAVSLVEVFKKNEAGIDNYYLNHVIDVNNPVVHTLNVYTDL